MHQYNQPPPQKSKTLPLVLASVAGVAALMGVGVVAYLFGRTHSADSDSAGSIQSGAGGSQVTPTPVRPTPVEPMPVAPGAQAPNALAVGQSPGDERVLVAGQHGAAYQHPLLFHYAHVGGAGIADVHGQLDHRDGHYFQLGPGDSLTLEAPDGSEFVSDGTDGVFDLELEVHPHDRASNNYEIDVSHAHLDVNGPWVVLGHGEAHEWDLDHVNLRAARYVRIRNLPGGAPLYVDGVYVRRMQVCTNPALCRDVNHVVRPR